MKKHIIIALIASVVCIVTWEGMHVVMGIDEEPEQVISIK